MKEIISISSKGIQYEENGLISFVDFEMCNRNWIASRTASGKEVTDWDSKCVGRRNVLDSPIWIEFFTEPKTRFEFESKETYRQLFWALFGVGWYTFDLS